MDTTTTRTIKPPDLDLDNPVVHVRLDGSGEVSFPVRGDPHPLLVRVMHNTTGPDDDTTLEVRPDPLRLVLHLCDMGSAGRAVDWLLLGHQGDDHRPLESMTQRAQELQRREQSATDQVARAIASAKQRGEIP